MVVVAVIVKEEAAVAEMAALVVVVVASGCPRKRVVAEDVNFVVVVEEEVRDKQLEFELELVWSPPPECAAATQIVDDDADVDDIVAVDEAHVAAVD